MGKWNKKLQTMLVKYERKIDYIFDDKIDDLLT